ncbi:unnamed protein product [Brugia pahangi]|uniref:Ovule protein n=1 Tax=Brugia pahangi TaxID=6280 RepID=A0A0N4TKS2_BRUPA|nr:unnamed protein product [Brugia pahangi]
MMQAEVFEMGGEDHTNPFHLTISHLANVNFIWALVCHGILMNMSSVDVQWNDPPVSSLQSDSCNSPCGLTCHIIFRSDRY